MIGTMATASKNKNVIDMAITFTAMMRIFERGAKAKISSRLEDTLGALSTVKSKAEFEQLHDDFCSWFVSHINTAAKERKGRITKASRCASYGQAAKVFDVAIKVLVHYCHLPSCEASVELLPLLHGGIDTPILNDLKKRYGQQAPKADTLEEIDRQAYIVLQQLIAKHIREEFGGSILPVHYDDIRWYQLNRA